MGKTWFVGVDWGSAEHAVCVLDAEGKVEGHRTVAHSGEGLSEMCKWLRGFAEGDASRVHVGIEVPHGPVVETLLEQGFVVFAINPKQLDRFRDRFTPAGAKDDRRDAHVLADSLRTDAASYRRLHTEAAQVVELRAWSRIAEDLVQERTRLGNRIHEQLRRYYPQMLELADEVSDPWLLALWELVPTPAKAQRVRMETVKQLLRTHRIRRFDAEAVLATLRKPALTVAPGATESAVAHIELAAEQLRLVHEQLRRAHRRIDQLLESLPSGEEPGRGCEQRDATILRSLPGVGRIVLATLLAEASEPLARRDYHALRHLTGVAPVTRQSGKSRVVVMRRACHVRLREALYHWARVATQNDTTTRAAYAGLRARGHSHGRALRSIADRLLAVACAMLRNQTAYDPNLRGAAA